MELTQKWFKSQWIKSKNQAGQRYSQELNVNLPLGDYFSAAVQDEEYFSKYSESASALNSRFKDTSLSKTVQLGVLTDEEHKQIVSKIKKVESYLKKISTYRSRAPIRIAPNRCITECKELQKELDTVSHKLYEIEKNEQDDTRKRSIEGLTTEISRLYSAIYNTQNLLDGTSLRAGNSPEILLLGPAGTGKTHLLCESVRLRVEDQKSPALLFLGQSFQSPFSDVVQVLADSLGGSVNSNTLLNKLNNYAIKRHTRCLICIDAVNEGHKKSWSKGIEELVAKVKKYQGLALVMSCRTPFEKILVPNIEKVGLIPAYHSGYPEDQQLEAVQKYFPAYGIPLPEIPLLSQEFSNPLFLKLFCEALAKVTIKKKHQHIDEITSGQKGMTHILEFFVKEKEKIISKKLAIPRGKVWEALKDGIATNMALHKRLSISINKALQITNQYQPAALRKGSILQELINEDILAEDVIFKKGKAIEAVRFTYQKFSDHLVARYLLSNYLDSTSKVTIISSLQSKSRLGVFFKKDMYGAIRNFGIIEALIMEFPTRIHNKGELMDYLGWKTFTVEFCNAFIEGLYWRDSKSFNKSTKRWISNLLNFESTRNNMFDLLLALSVKPRHPLKASVLNRYLSKIPMAQRDLLWTEYIRSYSYEGNTPDRILRWSERIQSEKVSKKYLKNFISILIWFLTTTKRSLRDRVSHAIFNLGLRNPDLVFNQTLQSLTFDDPYISERLLACSYGLSMSHHTSVKRKIFTRMLSRYSKELLKLMFLPNAPYSTTHILSRDYARKTIEIAIKIDPNYFSQEEVNAIKPPFSTGGIRTWGESEDKDKGQYRDGNSPLGMDFENYTLGRLVPSRGNYDYKNEDYLLVKRNLMWRIYNLGYEFKLFGEKDKEIARNSWYYEQRGNDAGKTERYGKKYSWIAYFELAGYRQDNGLLRTSTDERISDADIDPSFPTLFSYPQVFSESLVSHKGSLIKWITDGGLPKVSNKLFLGKIGTKKGPWILIDGFVDHTNGNKSIFLFFRGIIVKNSDLTRVSKAILDVEHPGNSYIPDSEEEYYSYAGEAPWSDTWHYEQYPKTIDVNGKEVEVEIPIREYCWEGHHSIENTTGTISLLSKKLCESEDLFVKVPIVSTKETSSGKDVAINIHSGERYKNSETLLFLHKKILDRYLNKQGASLLIIAWGERQAAHYEDIERESLQGLYKHHQMIHKQLYVYKVGQTTLTKLSP